MVLSARVCVCDQVSSVWHLQKVSPFKIPINKPGSSPFFLKHLTQPHQQKKTSEDLHQIAILQTYTLEKAAEAERDARCLDLAMELKWSRPGGTWRIFFLGTESGAHIFFQKKKRCSGGYVAKEKGCYCLGDVAKREFE